MRSHKVNQTDTAKVGRTYRSNEPTTEPFLAKKAKDPYRITGTILNEKYELMEYAGGGGMGAVYRALRKREGDIVAVKILKPDIVARNPEYAELFERETINARVLDHPNIVKVFDSDKDDDLSYMVMEWVEGSSIEDVITQGQLSIARIINIFEQVCSAIVFAHQRNIIHLDLKPANILLIGDEKPDDFVKVIDFGLSRVISKESGTTVTKFRGTHQYCSPEQFGGRVSHRSDIYSLGATLYHLITGILPFGTSYINAKIHPNLELPEIPSVIRQRNMPIEVDLVLRKALNKDPDLRQQSAKQLFKEFKDAMSLDSINLEGDRRRETKAAKEPTFEKTDSTVTPSSTVLKSPRLKLEIPIAVDKSVAGINLIHQRSRWWNERRVNLLPWTFGSVIFLGIIFAVLALIANYNSSRDTNANDRYLAHSSSSTDTDVPTGNENARVDYNATISRQEYKSHKEFYMSIARSSGSKIGKGINDDWLWVKARSIISSANELNDSVIFVDVDNAVVTLRGSASVSQKIRAEELVKHIDGVKNIENKIDT